LKDKLEKCRVAYEAEFENLCSQYGLIQNNMKILTEDKIKLKQKIIQLEQIISQ